MVFLGNRSFAMVVCWREKDKLEFPMDLQLVVTPCSTKMSKEEFQEMQSAVGGNDTHRLEAVLQKGHDPDTKDTDPWYGFGRAWFVISHVCAINNVGSALKSTSRSTRRHCTSRLLWPMRPPRVC